MRRVRRPSLSRLRVAMLGLRAPWGAEGGVELAVGELAPRLAASGVDVTVYCRGRYNPYGSGTRSGVRLIDTPTVYRRSLEALVHTALAAPRAAVTADVVHLHACGPALFSGLPALLRRPVVVTLHGKDWERDKWGPAARLFLRSGAWMAGHASTEIITVSRGLKLWCEENYPAPVTHIPNGVAPHVAVPWEPSVFPSLTPGGYHLFLGRLVPEKEIGTLLRAVARATPSLPVVITGGGSYTDDYVERLHRDAPAGVIFTGTRFGHDKAMLLTHARSFLFPSRVEGLPIALLEAMAAGLPTLTSDIPPNLEVLGSVGGWRLPVGDAHAWGAALHAVEASTPELLAAIGAEGRARVETNFGWDTVVTATRGVYERVLSRPAPPRAQ
ncbi:MAG: glycosyltransferase family 4 protein [Pseudomonadota bacterium]|nr:glycosyltransferase family 4 protein [Pseudomonadota bacterium]